jgi:hypothetical protein
MADPITYAFTDFNVSITGPGGSFSLSDGGMAKEGITIEWMDDDSTLTTGTGGAYMHSAHASRAARVTIRYLKNNPNNRRLMDMRNAQKAGPGVSGALTGRNVISIGNPYWGDEYSCRGGAFGKAPTMTIADDGGSNEWVMNFGDCDIVLGDGSLAL